MKKKIIIKGGNFTNKGAEAMLFTCVSKIKEKIPNVDITAMVYDYNDLKFKENNFCFNITSDISLSSLFYYLGGILKGISYLFLKIKNKKVDKSKFDLFKNSDILLDISGYALSSQWSFKTSLFYLLYIKLLKKYNIKVYLMPQSFGPFEYGGIKKVIIEHYIKKYLPYCEKIYAREQDGYDLLTKKYNLKNVEKSPDLVLQNKSIDYSFIFKEKPNIENIHIKESSVAIIPNVRVFERAKKINCLEFYENIINKVLSLNNNVVLLFHSTEDKEICRKLKEIYRSDDRIDMINKELSSFEYSSIVKKFKYIIASRYHSIVHGYKEIVPSITIGWAIKYKELMQKFNQDNYCVDIRNLGDNFDKVIELIENMENNLENNRKIIRKKLEEVQKNSCFKIFD